MDIIFIYHGFSKDYINNILNVILLIGYTILILDLDYSISKSKVPANGIHSNNIKFNLNNL